MLVIAKLFPLLLIATCLIVGEARSDVIHDASNYGVAGTNISGLVLADDFQITTSITPALVSVWLIEVTPDIPGVLEGFGGTLGWAIYPSSGSFPGNSPLAMGSDAAPVMVDVGEDGNGHDVFRADIDLPGSLSSGSLALSPGTYWFALHEGSYFSADDGSEIRWLRSLDPISGTRPRFDLNETAPGSAWLDIGVNIDAAFRMTAVPEPSGLALLSSSLFCIALVRRCRLAAAENNRHLNRSRP
jgi:hypothetical protein